MNKDRDGRRMEILCCKCDGHLGHVFMNEGFDRFGKSRTNQRHCVNSLSIKYFENNVDKSETTFDVE